MTKQYIITEADIKCFKSWIRALGYGSISDARQAEQTMLGTLKSLPELTGEPVAWMVTTELQDGTKRTYPATGRYEHVKDDCDFGEPIALYTHAQPPQHITAEDVTGEMRDSYISAHQNIGSPKLSEQIAAAYNAVIKHKGGTT